MPGSKVMKINKKYCLCEKRLKEIVKEVDEKSFVIVTDIREVLGKGFISDKSI